MLQGLAVSQMLLGQNFDLHREREARAVAEKTGWRGGRWSERVEGRV
jgi:hypothetical protein